jgi:hypothetical protein
MQDCYAGDIGDYGKLGLLRCLAQKGLIIGVNWYKVVPDQPPKNNDGGYGIPPRFDVCDPILAQGLRTVFGATDRSISLLMDGNWIRNAVYYDADLSHTDRVLWHDRALRVLKSCDAVFLDPDNGLVVPSATRKTRHKYVLDYEIGDYIRRGQSVILYNHRPRKQADAYFSEIWERLAAIEGVKPTHISYMTFPRCSVRDYFMIAADDEHRRVFQDTIADMLSGIWGQTGMCRIEK